MRHALFAGALALSSHAAFADPVPEVQRFLKEEILKLQSVAEPAIDGPRGPVYASGHALSLFRLRIRAEFGFDVGLARVTLQPFAEFFWE